MREIFSLASWQAGKLPKCQTLLLFLYTVVLLLYFFLLTFPHDLLLKQLKGSLSESLPASLAASLSQNMAVDLTYAQGRFAWWQGYELRGVTLRLAPRPTPVLSNVEGPDSDFPLLSFSRLFVRPRLHRLILGQLFPLRVHGELYGGSLEGEFLGQEPLVHGFLALHRIDLSRYRSPFLTGLTGLTGARVDGTMSVEASFTGQVSDPHTHLQRQRVETETRSLPSLSLSLSLEGGGVTGGKVSGISLPQLRFSRIRLHGRLEKDRVEVQEFVGQLDGLEVQGQGQIRLRTPLSRSLIDLRFSFEATASLSPELRTLLAFLPASPDSPANRTLVISGTVGHPLLR
jgi:type II secretion system protein N